MLLRVYLVNGKHTDVPLVKGKPAGGVKEAAYDLAKAGVWSSERGEEIYYPGSQILYIRVVKDKDKSFKPGGGHLES